MLYKLKRSGSTTTFTFVRLAPTTMSDQGLSEKALEQWLADNPHAVLPDEEQLLVISQERPFQNLVDILAIDQEGNAIIIELKRGQTPRDVIAQTLEYAAEVATWDYQELNRRATAYLAERGLTHESLLAAFQEAFAIAPGEMSETRFNRRQRTFVVGEEIDPKIERTARWLLRRGVDIGCVAYGCYSTDDGDLFLDFEQAVRPQESVGDPNGVRVTTMTDEDFINRMTPALKAVYERLRSRAVAIGPDVSVGATRLYIKLGAGTNFAEAHPRRDSLRVYVRPEGLGLAANESGMAHGLALKRVSDVYGWTMSVWFTVDEHTDLDAVETVLRGSYAAIRGRA